MFFAGLLLLGIAGVAEVGARAIDAASDMSLVEHRSRYLYRRHCRLGHAWPAQRGDYPYLPFLPNPTDSRVNDLGFRGKAFSFDKPANTYRIACLGGSTTWNGYPELLEEMLRPDFATRGLNLEVVNAGNVCWTTMESQINFVARCLPLKPDAIVVYHAINDALPAFGEEHSADYAHWRRRLEQNEPLVWDHVPLWLDYSAAYVAFRAIFERNIATNGFDMTTQYTVNFEEAPYHGMEPFRQNLYTLISIARARDIEVFLTTFVFNPEYKFKYRVQRWGDAVADANKIVRSFADRWDDVHVIDAASALTGSNEWMTDMCHFTDEGKRRLTTYIAAHMQPHLARIAARPSDPTDIARLLLRTSTLARQVP